MPDWNRRFDNPRNILRQADPLQWNPETGARALDLGCVEAAAI